MQRLAILAVLLCSTAFVAYAQQDIKKILAADSAVGTYVFNKQAWTGAATDKTTTGVWLMKKHKHSKHGKHSDDNEYKYKQEHKPKSEHNYKGDDSDYEQKSKSKYAPKDEPKKYEEPHKYESKDKPTHKYPPKEEEPHSYEPKQPKHEKPHAYEPKGDEPHHYKPDGPEHYGPGPKYDGPGPNYGGPGPKYGGPGPKQHRRHGPMYMPYRPEYPPHGPEDYPHEEDDYGYGGPAVKLCLQEISRDPAGSFDVDGTWTFDSTFGCCSEYADQVTPVANCTWTAVEQSSDLLAQVGTVEGSCQFIARDVCVPHEFPLNVEFDLSDKANETYWLSVDAALQNGTYPYGAYAAAIGDKNSKASMSAAEPKAAQPVYSSDGEYEYVPVGYPMEASRGKASIFNAMIASKEGLLKGGTVEYTAGFVDENGDIICPTGASGSPITPAPDVANGVLPMVKCGELKLKLWLAPEYGPYHGYDGEYHNPSRYYDPYDGPHDGPYYEQEEPYYRDGPEHYQRDEEYYMDDRKH